MEKLFAIAKITHAAGLKGEVRVRPLSRYFDDYISGNSLFLGFSESISREVTLVNQIGNGKKIRYQFSGVESRNDAEAMIGQIIYASVGESEEIRLISKDLIGATVVTESGDVIGELNEILWAPSNDIYVINNGTREFLIPVIPEIIKEVSSESGVIVIVPMDGLLD